MDELRLGTFLMSSMFPILAIILAQTRTYFTAADILGQDQQATIYHA